MFELKGKYNSAKVFTDDVENQSISQVIHFLNQPFVKDEKIRMMSDIHAGSNCTIGTTMTITDKVVPNLVGSDIGCGMEVVYLDCDEIDFNKLDNIIRENIPYGYDVRDTPHKYINRVNLADMYCYFKLDGASQGNFSMGTLGGGNHFIEVNKTSNDELMLVIHTGSRRLGVDVCEYYQNQALMEFKRFHNYAPDKDLIYCEGKLFDYYLHDMKIMQDFAMWNRRAIASTILEKLGVEYRSRFMTVHNYIDLDKMILRKGAVSALKNETLIIPINMRDGSLICKGKGNSDWNYSAPHGAGRLMSRSKAKESISLEEFEKTMEGVFSTSVIKSNISESPMAYKPMESILNNIEDTADVVDIAKPLYNFKA